MIRVTLRIPLDPYSFIEINAKASNPTKIMESLRAMVRAMGNKTANEFWAKYFVFHSEPEVLAPPVPIIKTLVKSSPLSAPVVPPMNETDRYNYLNKTGEPYTCKTCHGLISWDKYPNVRHPIHVDKDGKIIGDGSCPSFGN